ncbi:putative transporter [Microlunatus phosphovorus NM-1]|uniref:Putative transporter n=2 Tax=Microlunatus phosphovorus TaxID=29405 RepID=F5XGX4_MICPN|nr:putative transporter [Microlunatus phosphovorus NM-1]
MNVVNAMRPANAVASVRSYLMPLLPGRRDYRRLPHTWRGDLLAGVTVGIVALPLALAFGISSGAGAEAGLVTAVVAGIVAAVFGGSHIQVSGPTGAMVVVLGPIVATHGAGAIALVSIMAGILVLLLGVLKLGRTVSYIPWPVIEGFTLGIAVIIFLQQVPAAVGVPSPHGENAVVAAIKSIGQASTPEVFWTIGAVLLIALIMVGAPRLHPKLPGSMIAIVIVTVAATLVHAPIARIGTLPDSLPAPSMPPVDPVLVMNLSGAALTVAALAAIESLLSARVAASISDTGPYDADRELVGQGLASVAAGLFGGMPATGAIARTAVNLKSGGRSRLAAVTHGLVLLAVVYVGTGVVSQIPLSALAGVLMVTATRMVPGEAVRSVLSSSRSGAATFVLTAVITVSFDLIVAVGIGIGVAALFALRTLARSSGVHREEIAGPADPADARIAVFRLDGALFFGVAERLLDRVLAIDHVEVVILRLSQIQIMDATGARVIGDVVRTLERRGITVLLKGVRPQHLTLVSRTGALEALAHEKHLYDDLPAAVEHARVHVHRAARHGPPSSRPQVGNGLV